MRRKDFWVYIKDMTQAIIFLNTRLKLELIVLILMLANAYLKRIIFLLLQARMTRVKWIIEDVQFHMNRNVFPILSRPCQCL